MQLQESSQTDLEENDVLDRVKDDEVAVCEIHKIPLRIGYAPVEYGLPVNAAAYQEIRLQRFPHAADPVNAGCIVGPWKRVRVKMCYKCQSAYITWKQTEQLNTE